MKQFQSGDIVMMPSGHMRCVQGFDGYGMYKVAFIDDVLRPGRFTVVQFMRAEDLTLIAKSVQEVA